MPEMEISGNHTGTNSIAEHDWLKTLPTESKFKEEIQETSI